MTRAVEVDARDARERALPDEDEMALAGELLDGATIADGEDIKRLIAVGIALGRSLETGHPIRLDPYTARPCRAVLANRQRCERPEGHGGRHKWVNR